MMRVSYKLCFLSTLGTLYVSQSLASLQNQCLLGVPYFSGTVITGNLNEQPIYVESNSAELNNPISAIYKGDVDIKQGNRHLTTDIAEIKKVSSSSKIEHIAYAENGFHYQDDLIQLSGSDAKVNLNSKDIEIKNSSYQFVNRQGRGQAESIKTFDNYRIMKDAIFTSCLQNDNSWSIQASEMKQYVKDEYAEMWHARFRIYDTPIFYFPYLQFPIGDRRRSGLLIPNVGYSSRDGSWVYWPVYWNIAPDFDATFTPKYMSRRGWQLDSEFRYLAFLGEGQIATEYLAKDHYDKYSYNKPRYLVYWKHNTSFLNDWRLHIDYTKVSDRNYFTDFDSKYGGSTDGYANQNISLSYYQPNYSLRMAVKQFQIFDNITIKPYRVLPQIDFNYYKNGLLKDLIDFRLYAQAAHFDSGSDLMPAAWRFHLEPTFDLSLVNPYGSLNFQTKLYATHYRQKQGRSLSTYIQEKVNRVLPQIKVDFQTLLAKKNSLFDGYTQTIEPHIQYLYRPYRNQSNIGSQSQGDYIGLGYDSSLVQQDYYSLFSERRYSGLDRIASANQFTIGATTRFYDKSNKERFNLSLGQIYYLNNSRIDDLEENSTNNSTSAWALETNWRINNRWNWRGSYQYSPNLKITSLANTILEYNPRGNDIIQLSYRYASKEYIDQNSKLNNYDQDIQQLGLVTGWDLTDNWAIAAHYYQDLSLRKPLEQYIGVKYNTCCWSVGIGARRYVTNRIDKNNDNVVYDNSINVNFELRGLGNSFDSGVVNMLSEGKLPYLKPFSIY